MNIWKSGIYKVVEGGKEPDKELVAVVHFKSFSSLMWFSEVAREAVNYDNDHNRIFGYEQVDVLSFGKVYPGIKDSVPYSSDVYPADMLKAVVKWQHYANVEKLISFIVEVQAHEMNHYYSLQESIEYVYRRIKSGKKSGR